MRRFPKAIDNTNCVRDFFPSQNALMFVRGDAAFGFEMRFWPKRRGEHRKRQPAKIEREVVKPFQIMVNGDFAVFQHGQKIFGGRFQYFLCRNPSKTLDFMELV